LANVWIADEKDSKLMSSSGLEASEQDIQDVLQEFEDENSAGDGLVLE
jgi:hypothetical protein